jgi:ubiquinone/menaquinone biosynthesis C-methylase UbiE
MLAHARRRAQHAAYGRRVSLVRGDIRALPFRKSTRFDLVMAPYGILQSLIRESDLRATLASIGRVLSRRGVFGLDLVPDLPVWKEYRNQVRFRGRRPGTGSQITLIESVRQDRKKGLTTFDQHFVETRGRARAVRNFSLVFRTLTIGQMTTRLERAGFRVTAVLGDYKGRPWDPRADVWLMLAERA